MNTNFTKNPIVGTPLTPSVIKQIHTAVRRYMPIAGNGIRTSVTAGGTIISVIPAPTPKKQKDKPLPFEVRYDGTLDDGAGGWKIYLPTEHLVQFDGAYLDPLNDVTPILDANGDETGWYSFDEITLQDDHVWLVISESSGAYTASFANAEDQYAVANICIAEVSYEEPEDEGGTPTVEIKQSVVGAIVMSSGGGGVVPDDISTEFIPDPPPGKQPDGDEGKLQIKDWKDTTVVDANTISDYLQSVVAIPQDGIQVVARFPQVGGSPLLGYVPLAALDLDDYAKQTDLPTVNDGTLTIKQGTTTLGTFTANQATPATVTIPEPPTPPTVNDGTLTIKQGTTTLGTFTANQSTNTTVTIPGPPTPPSGTVEFVADVDWYVNGSVHQLRKRLRVLDLATGQVTDKAGTTYANGWEVLTNTTPISSIMGS